MSIKVLSLNMWGVPVVSKKVKERSHHLIDYLLASDYDVVGLQEVFMKWHAQLIAEGVQSIFGHHHWYRSGSLGSPGLLVISRYPITEVGFHTFTLNGYPQHVHRGDWWAGKGVGLCRIEHPVSTLDFYVTHLHANYVHTGYDMYTGHRINQMFTMAKFIAQSRRSQAVIALGDFNSVETEVPTKVFVEMSGLTDSYRELYPNIESHPGYTNDTPECSWRAKSKSAEMCSNSSIKRIDYVFYNDNYLACKECEVVCGQIPDQTYSYSDHLGVSATFYLSTANPDSPLDKMFKLSRETSGFALQSLERSLRQAYSDKTQKLVIWLLLVTMWLGVIVLGGLKFLSAPVVGVLASAIAACATAVFWYLILFCRAEIAKFVEARNEMSVISRFSE